MTLHVKYTFDYRMGGNSAKCETVVDLLVLKDRAASLIHIMHKAIPTGM